MTGTPCLKMPNDRTEAEIRATGHTETPWYVSPTIEGGRRVFNLFKQNGKYALPIRAATEADAYFVCLAVNSHDAMREAMAELLEQIECLGGIEFSKDLEPYKAEAVWDDAIKRAQDALQLARGAKP